MHSHRVPLHLSRTDWSPEAIQQRIDLHVNAQQMTGGKGFRQPPKTGADPTYLSGLIKMAGLDG
jgi:hypothetical protein